MKIMIAGGHGKIALLLIRRLADAGHDAVGIIRNPDHTVDVEAAGGTALVADLEQIDADTLASHLRGADAVVFAAGGGNGSGAERKLTVDRDGAILLADAAERAGVDRYVMVSSIRADDYDRALATLPAKDDAAVFQVYFRAKSEADADLRERNLRWTIIRPGTLTDGAATGTVTAATRVERGSIPRDDVAAIITHVLLQNTAIGRQFEVIAGDTAIVQAIASL